jgi:hypothetical protein
MTNDAFTQLLTDLGARADGPSWLLPEGSDLAIFVGLAGETLTVSRVTRLTLRGQVALATCARGERFGFHVDDVRAVKG